MSKELVVTPQQSHILALSPVRSATPPQPAQATALPLRTLTHARSRRSPSTSKTWTTRTPASCPGVRLEQGCTSIFAAATRCGPRTGPSPSGIWVTRGARLAPPAPLCRKLITKLYSRGRGAPRAPPPRTVSHCTLAIPCASWHPHASGKPEFDILQIIKFCFLGCVSIAPRELAAPRWAHYPQGWTVAVCVFGDAGDAGDADDVRGGNVWQCGGRVAMWAIWRWRCGWRGGRGVGGGDVWRFLKPPLSIPVHPSV